MKFLAPFAIVAVALFSSCSTKSDSTAIPLDSLFKNYHEERLKLFPLQATSIGDNRYNDILPNNLSQEYRTRVKNFYESYRDQLASIDRTTLTENEQLSYDILTYECNINLEGYKFRDYLAPITQIGSMHLTVSLLTSGNGNQPFKTVKDYDNWLSRLNGYLAWGDTAIANMRKGIAEGYVIPKPLAQKVVPQLANFDHGPAKEHHYYTPVKNIPAEFSQEDKDRIAKSYEEMIETKIIPMHARLKEFFEKEYIPACRETSGIDAIPQGKEYYAYLVKRFTTTNKTPDEIFALGNSEVERISKEMEKVKEQVNYKGDLKSFFEHLRNRKELMPFKTADEIIARYNAIHEQMKPNLVKLFDKVPRMAFEVRRVEAFREATTAANYNVGTVDGSRPGIFYFPIKSGPEKYSYMQMEDLFLHEAIPGHHYQVALKVENTTLPEFRRFINYGAYAEGWGLYAESLGKELGLYTDPYSYFGMLSGEMHRAIRLVVDAGLHYQGWTREQAIQYSKEHEAAAEDNIISEIERYMANPGQALSYKMGQLKILELRAKAEKELGDKFNIREFHNQMLDVGSLPLELLDQKITRWIESQKAL